MDRNKYFGNCIRCGNYAHLQLHSMCLKCFKEDIEKLEKAVRLVNQVHEMNMENVASTLDIDISLVEEWVHTGRLRFHHQNHARYTSLSV